MKVTTHMLGSRRIGQFIDLKPLDTNATVKEAIDKSAFASLTSADSGQAIVFTVKGCYNKATKSAVFNCAPVVPEPTYKYRVKIADDAGTLHAFDKEVVATA